MLLEYLPHSTNKTVSTCLGSDSGIAAYNEVALCLLDVVVGMAEMENPFTALVARSTAIVRGMNPIEDLLLVADMALSKNNLVSSRKRIFNLDSCTYSGYSSLEMAMASSGRRLPLC